ncbi:MAG: hypothetical protein EON93_11195 [Burkholderiales bacterium]|nr:MAG: hypothetical protein EON93_11195 [Burkholderiales bacterium]
MSDTIVRVFDHPRDALRAVERVEALGVSHNDVSLVANNREGWYDDKAHVVVAHTECFDTLDSA